MRDKSKKNIWYVIAIHFSFWSEEILYIIIKFLCANKIICIFKNGLNHVQFVAIFYSLFIESLLQGD